MDSVEGRDSPPAFPAAPWLCPADRMVVRRFRPLKYLRDVFLKGLRFGKAEYYEKYEGRGTIRTRISELLQSSETSDMILQSGEEMNFPNGMRQFRRNARHYYYVNSWNTGTDESKKIWKKYANLEDGVAIETTVGQLLRNFRPELELSMGAVRYLDWWREVNPQIPQSLYFTKHRQFEDEQEFRMVYNLGGNPLLLLDSRELPEEALPNYEHPLWINGDWEDIVNRVILAPRADREVRRRTEKILSEFDLDVPIEESSIGRSDITSSREYQAELVGTDNYSSSFRYYTRHRQDFLDNTDWDQCESVDLVLFNPRGQQNPRSTIGEHYRNFDGEPSFDEYHHDRLRYEVRVTRIYPDGTKEHHLNDYAEYSELLSQHSLERTRLT